MTTKFIKAGICDKAEAMKRMIDGEEFYLYGRRIFFKESHDRKSSPFRVENSFADGDEAVMGFWSSVKYWDSKVEVNWYDDIPSGGILCWVSDDDEEDKRYARVIHSCNSGLTYPFRADHLGYRYATPVTADDLEPKAEVPETGC